MIHVGHRARVLLEFSSILDEVRRMAGPETDSEHAEPGTPRVQEIRSALLAWFRRRVSDPSEAEDLTQESFLRVTQRGDQETVAHFDSYLYKTARSVLIDRSRRRTVRHADEHGPLLPEHGDAQEADALRSLLAKEKLQQVAAVLTAMPERTRSIFILCRLEGLRYSEIATRFDISVSAVQKHMLRAIEALLIAEEDRA